ncbi:hypothetical protein MHTCC0001_16510 [Flavobacteriaceae bacterium MHTCC 0001]
MKNLKRYNVKGVENAELQEISGGFVFVTSLLVAALIGTAGVTAGYFYHNQ